MSVAKEVGRRLSTHDLSWHDDTQNCNFAQVGKILEEPKSKILLLEELLQSWKKQKKIFVEL